MDEHERSSRGITSWWTATAVFGGYSISNKQFFVIPTSSSRCYRVRGLHGLGGFTINKIKLVFSSLFLQCGTPAFGIDEYIRFELDKS
jgi:hypothetical protein